MKRKCGACTLCCTALAVPELDKPNGVPCKHLTPTGCGIYDDRPDSCRAFECMYLQGEGDLTTRPDKVGAVQITEDGGEDVREPAAVFYVDPDRPERWRRSKYLRRVVERTVRRGTGTFIVNGDERTLISHPDSRLSRKLRALKEAGEL